ncbi:MAG: hypothetical protein M3P23_10875 [Actinomycetota bacterium]|nr:hypothetical protein [Actinomycetota bacterium]
MVFVGFTAFLLAAGTQRALIVDPLIVSSSTQERPEGATGSAVRLACTYAGLLTAAVLLLGLVVPGTLGHGLLVMTPWVFGGLMQDLWRSILFRDRRGAAAAANDAVWALGMILFLPVVFSAPSAWTVAADWGVGATLAALLGFVQVRVRLARFGDAWRWLKEVRRLSIGFATTHTISALGIHGTTLLLAGLLTASDFGGLRAAQALFAPMTLLYPAMMLPGVPALTRRLADSYVAARRVALEISGGAVLIIGCYVIAMAATGGRLLEYIFGDDFSRFDYLFLPILSGQVIVAAGLGFSILVTAAGRTGVLISSRLTGAVTGLMLSLLLTPMFGVVGAAWALTIAPAAAAAVATAHGFRSNTEIRPLRPAPPEQS